MNQDKTFNQYSKCNETRLNYCEPSSALRPTDVYGTVPATAPLAPSTDVKGKSELSLHTLANRFDAITTKYLISGSAIEEDSDKEVVGPPETMASHT